MSDLDGLDPQKTAMQIAASLAKDVYQDGLQPPVRVVGETLAGILRAITHYPRFWGQISEISLESKTERFKDNLSRHINAIPEENRVLPHPNIIGPSVQALEYGIFDDHLSDMFASLISTSMNSRTSDLAHSSFVEIIKQIDSDEAKIINLMGFMGGHNLFAICDIQLEVTDLGAYRTHLSKYHTLCLTAGCTKTDKYREVVDNLERLKIIEVNLSSMGATLSEKKHYEPLLNNIEINDNIKIVRPKDGEITNSAQVDEYYPLLGVFSITAFGMQFYKACVKQL